MYFLSSWYAFIFKALSSSRRCLNGYFRSIDMKGYCYLDKLCEFTSLGDLSPLSVFWHQSYLSIQTVPQSLKEHCSRRKHRPPDPLGPLSQLLKWAPSLSSRLSSSRILKLLTLRKRCLCSHPTLYSTISPNSCCRSQEMINQLGMSSPPPTQTFLHPPLVISADKMWNSMHKTKGFLDGLLNILITESTPLVFI